MYQKADFQIKAASARIDFPIIHVEIEALKSMWEQKLVVEDFTECLNWILKIGSISLPGRQVLGMEKEELGEKVPIIFMVI